MGVYDVPNPTHPPGTRVEPAIRRTIDATIPGSPTIAGTVIAVYRAPAAGWDELCVVEWDDGTTTEGNIPSGLTPTGRTR
jgi:hypothetical protein